MNNLDHYGYAKALTKAFKTFCNGFCADCPWGELKEEFDCKFAFACADHDSTMEVMKNRKETP